jgi:hypothetical protein
LITRSKAMDLAWYNIKQIDLLLDYTSKCFKAIFLVLLQYNIKLTSSYFMQVILMT